MYGLLISIGILASGLVGEKIAKNQKLDVNIFWGGLIVAIPAGVVGARMYFVLANFDYYKNNLVKIFYIHEGGLVIFGGIAFAVAGLFFYLKHHNQNYLEWFDLIAIITPLGQAIGRIGNHFNKELLPFSYYEMIYNIFAFVILVSIYFRQKNMVGSGVFTVLYLCGYSLIRIFLEPLRVDTPQVANLNLTLVVSVFLLLVSTVLAAYTAYDYKISKTKTNKMIK